jgi:dTDP-4-dehydrorhamnose reductase
MAAPHWLIVGAAGQLGTDLVRALPADDVVALDLPDIDITREASVQATVSEVRPRVVVNAAAYTAVDAAEDDAATAWAINADGPALLAKACADVAAMLVQVSTDYVFDGTASAPYEVDTETAPRSEYGRSKLAGEDRVRELLAEHYVVRTAWLYGAHGANFVRTMIRLAGERPTVDVVDDQRGQPTWSADLADYLVRLAESGLPPGVYHGTSAGATTWCGLAKEIFTLLGADPARVRPVPSTAHPRPAARPANSVLAHTRWEPIRHWREALHAAWPEVGKDGPHENGTLMAEAGS